MRKLPARFSNRKAFFMFGVMFGVMLGVLYGFVLVNNWSQTHIVRTGYPVKISFHSPIWVEEATRSAYVAGVVEAKTMEEPKVPTEEEKKDLAIRKYFPEQFALAKAVAMSEGYRSNGVNSNPPIEESVGLFQVNLLAHYRKVPGKTIAEKTEWLLNYENNCSVARQIYEGSGWNAWSGYLHESYLKFL